MNNRISTNSCFLPTVSTNYKIFLRIIYLKYSKISYHARSSGLSRFWSVFYDQKNVYIERPYIIQTPGFRTSRPDFLYNFRSFRPSFSSYLNENSTFNLKKTSVRVANDQNIEFCMDYQYKFLKLNAQISPRFWQKSPGSRK